MTLNRPLPPSIHPSIQDPTIRPEKEGRKECSKAASVRAAAFQMPLAKVGLDHERNGLLGGSRTASESVSLSASGGGRRGGHHRFLDLRDRDNPDGKCGLFWISDEFQCMIEAPVYGWGPQLNIRRLQFSDISAREDKFQEHFYRFQEPSLRCHKAQSSWERG